MEEMRVHCHNGLTPRDKKVENCEYDVVCTRGELSSRTSCDKLYIRTTLLRRVHYLINAKLYHVIAYLTFKCASGPQCVLPLSFIVIFFIQVHRRSSTTMLHNSVTPFTVIFSLL